MKENRLLKLLSYVLIPILIGIILISVFYETEKEYFDEEKYFSSNSFTSVYILGLRNNISDLVYNYDDNYKSIKDRKYEDFL